MRDSGKTGPGHVEHVNCKHMMRIFRSRLPTGMISPFVVGTPLATSGYGIKLKTVRPSSRLDAGKHLTVHKLRFK